jgi:GNAT superfamily N-acetyltransferase
LTPRRPAAKVPPCASAPLAETPTPRPFGPFSNPPCAPAKPTRSRWTFPATPQREVFVAEHDAQILGTYFLQPNQQGGGAHVANCGYVTAAWATGRGVARAMCVHSLEHARSRGFSAMQFNFVVSTNERAIALWQSVGFRIVGRLPGAFRHPTAGFVDALVMYRSLL